MKRISTSDVKANNSMEVKRHTLIITSCEARMNSKERAKEGEQAFSNHVTIKDADYLEVEVNPNDAQEKIVDEEGFQHGREEYKL